jgi:predicted RNase H-like HicB family nuclease
MFTQYVEKAMRKAQYELIEDGTYFGSIPGFQGVWGNGSNLEECREDLRGSLEGWLILGLWMNDPDIPKLGKLDLVPRKAPSSRNESHLAPRTRKAS